MKNYYISAVLLASFLSAQSVRAETVPFPNESKSNESNAEYDVAMEVSLNNKLLVACQAVLSSGDLPCARTIQEAYIKSVKNGVITPGVFESGVNGIVNISAPGSKTFGTASVEFTNMQDPTYVVKTHSKGKTTENSGLYNDKISFDVIKGTTSKSVGAFNVKVTVSEKTAQTNVRSVTLNNETYTYDPTLARESRTINVKILRGDRNFFGNKRMALLNDFTVSGAVAASKYNDNPKAFSVPISVTREHSYASKITKTEVTPATVSSGFSGFIALSDASSKYVGSMDVTYSSLKGFSRVDEKDYNIGSENIYNAPMVENESFHMVLKEGINVQKFGEYTVITDVSPIAKRAVAGL